MYYCTAMQLGIHAGVAGVPSLLHAALPRETSLLALRWARRTLLQPPPPDVGAALRTACRLFSGAAHAAITRLLLSPEILCEGTCCCSCPCYEGVMRPWALLARLCAMIFPQCYDPAP